MAFIVTVIHKGKEVPLRGTVWAFEMDRATKHETHEAAEAALVAAKKFMHSRVYKKATIKEIKDEFAAQADASLVGDDGINAPECTLLEPQGTTLTQEEIDAFELPAAVVDVPAFLPTGGAPEAAKVKAPAAPKAPTKKAQVLALIEAAPHSVEMIAAEMSITTGAANALIGDLKRAKVQIETIKVAGQKVQYKA
ncbi:hypothetical protein LJR220_003055 [Bradyrhizobium sp. LjRoot220]|uniref:hypothetical protein n=1 Tax=Bradyrhizobium sp. LjRoot220 TaxID=3342284 RepID=UPI003ECF211F